jgi:hypothetical protein
VLVHRDSDCLLPDEIEWYVAREQAKLPARCKLFFTPLTDIEHQFCQPAHVAAALNMSAAEATALVEGLIAATAGKFAMEFSQKRADLKSKILRDKENVPSATDLAPQRVAFAQVKGKSLWGALNGALIAAHRNPMHLLTTKTDALKIPALSDFVTSVWKPEELASPSPAPPTVPYPIITGVVLDDPPVEPAPTTTPAASLAETPAEGTA